MTDTGDTEQLTQRDVERLLADPSPASRVQLAGKVAAVLIQRRVNAAERALAEGILRIMARDAALRVRRALAEQVRTMAELPRDIALALARDVEEVALPVLEVSPVFSDEDLVEIILAGSEGKQTAIARRPTVSRLVAMTLVETAPEGPVAVLMGNAGAELDETHLARALDRFPDSNAVMTPMVYRDRLPVTIAERLVSMVSDNLKDYLVTHHELSPDTAADLVRQAREKATASLLGPERDETSLERLVEQLVQHRRLTSSLLLRALCMGDTPFFEHGLAKLARVPVSNARVLIYDAGPLGLKSIYEKAGLPPRLLPAFRVAIDVAQETPLDGGPGDRERHQRHMLERILTQFEGLQADDLDYLLRKLDDFRILPRA